MTAFHATGARRLALANGCTGATARVRGRHARWLSSAVSGRSRCRAGSEMLNAQGTFVAAQRTVELRTNRAPAPDRGRAGGGSRQLIEQPLGVFQVGGVEALGKRAVDGREQLVRLAPSVVLAPQPGKARGSAQFVATCTLLASDRQGGA